MSAEILSIIAVDFHEYGRILSQLDHANVTVVQMFRSTLLALPCTIQPNYNLRLDFCYQLFVCHFIFASVLVCSDTWSQRLDLALKQWIRYVARVYLFCIFSGLMSTSHDVRLMSFFPDRKSRRIRHLGFLDFSQKLGNPRVISKEIEA